MAKLFISYKNADTKIAQRLEQHLLSKGHRMAIPVGADVAGNWRTKFSQALVSSDACIVVLSETGLASKNVVGEIGAARAIDNIKGMPLLPVLIGEMPIPDFINDIYCLRLRGDTEDEVAKVATQLDKSIHDSVAKAPRIFISHRHIDESIAAALVNLLEQAFNITKNDIRCTSVKPYMLAPGERTSEQLRSDLSRAELVIGILSPDTVESNYVLCELGAAWGRDVATFPVLARGATIKDVPSPLNERHNVSLEKETECLDLIEHVASKTTLTRKESSLGKLSEEAKRLTRAAAQRLRPATRPAASPEERQAEKRRSKSSPARRK